MKRPYFELSGFLDYGLLLWLLQIIVQVIFYFLWGHLAHPGYFENRIPLKLALGGVCSLANYSVAYEETQSNRVSDFHDFFVCSLFPKAIFFTFILRLIKVELQTRRTKYSGRLCI